MSLRKILAIVTLAGSLGVAIAPETAQAQIRKQQPAEFPPASYKGKQYVDSQGCVFIRAGIDGDVSWVPRVTRDRKTICGFRPSAGANVAAATPALAPVEAPVQITIDTPAPAAAPQPAPRRTAQVAAPAPKPRRVAAPVVVRQTAPRPAPAPKPRVVAAPKIVAPAPQVRRTTVAAGQANCANLSPIAQQYMRGSNVRCGPQTQPIVGARVASVTTPRVGVPQATARRTYATAPVAGVSSNTRIVPKHVAQNRVNTRNVAVPRGYKSVWEDDRLNPYRAEQTLNGRSQMLLVWTQTLPRRLIDQRTGRDVTASVPLVYPYTSVAQQRQQLGEVTLTQRNGQRVKRIVRNPGAKPVVRQPVYSTRSAPKAAAPKPAKSNAALAGKSYVQVGTFRDPNNAQRTARNIARMGMPARIGKYRKGGHTYMNVQAGPFNGSRAMQTAMNRLRGAGYRDAFAR